jgi:TolA-binding protein
MRKLIAAVILISLVYALPSHAEKQAGEESEKKSVVREVESHNLFRGVAYKVWVKLRSFSPRGEDQAAGRGDLIVTAGIRGAESKESTLKPYWKDDRTNDKDFIEQVDAFNAAQTMVDDGKIEEAKAALQKFIKRYPEGELLPNALFAQGLTLSASGDASTGSASLQKFIHKYPKHPLKGDAELILAEISAQK